MSSWILGKDYETRDSIAKECGITIQALNHRRRKLEERGFTFSVLRKDGEIVYLKSDADLLIDYHEGPRTYPKNRKEKKGNRPGRRKVKKGE